MHCVQGKAIKHDLCRNANEIDNCGGNLRISYELQKNTDNFANKCFLKMLLMKKFVTKKKVNFLRFSIDQFHCAKCEERVLEKFTQMFLFAFAVVVIVILKTLLVGLIKCGHKTRIVTIISIELSKQQNRLNVNLS